MEANQINALSQPYAGNGIGKPAKALLFIAAAASVAVSALGTGDVVSTFLFNKPIPGVLEATEMLLVVIIFMAQPFIVLSGAHITLDLISMRPRSVLLVARTAITVVAGVLCYGLIAWTAFDAFLSSLAVGEKTGGSVGLPVYPVRLLIVFGSLVSIVYVLYVGARAVMAPRQQV